MKAGAFALVLSLAAVAGARTLPAPVDRAEMARRVRAEMLHAWKGYEAYAWGHDELKPLSGTAHDWYGPSLFMTPVDALDTLLLMGLTDEADKAKALVLAKLDFDRDISVKNFEITIRLLGGLLSSYQLTGDARLLALADDLGRRLLPAFDSPTGMPYVNVNLRRERRAAGSPTPPRSGRFSSSSARSRSSRESPSITTRRNTRS